MNRRDPLNVSLLEAATIALDHRGPDKQKWWFAPNRRVGLGHARLSIIDLETGDQPLTNEDETIHLVVNGEFYGYEAIQRDLRERGHRLGTNSDSEIALHLYEEAGPKCLSSLRGEFAFVLWDDANQLLFAARDRFGIKPLFYSVVNDNLYIASEVKALFQAGVPARWDPESFFQQLFVYQNQDRTLFEGVYQLPPGHYMVATRRHLQIIRYWDLDYPKSDGLARGLSESDHIERLRFELLEAIRLRLRADVPVGCLLSGGLDSSSVLGMAAQHHSGPIRAFTVAFDHPDYDEKPIAMEMADHAGAEFDCITVTHSDIADHIADTVCHGETLGVNWHAVARYLLCQNVRDSGYRVVLSGEGADELFAGYLQARQDLLLSEDSPNRHSYGSGQAGRPASNAAQIPSSLTFVNNTLGFIPAWLKKLAISRSIFSVLLSADYAAEVLRRDPYRIFLSQFDVSGQLTGRDVVIQSLYLWSRSILPNYTLFAERLEMAHSVEARIPFLDHKVFEVVREMPVSLLIREAREKYVLREAARPFLSDTVYRRPKHPFLAPPSTIDPKGPLHSMVQDTLRGPQLAAVPFFDRASVSGLLDALPNLSAAKRLSLDSVLLMIVCACVLQDRYKLACADFVR
jgi:asparagine synthase (glutamine-hydrolysing)